MMSLFCASSPANDGGEVGASAASLILSQVRRGGSVWRLDRRGETIITADWATEDGEPGEDGLPLLMNISIFQQH